MLLAIENFAGKNDFGIEVYRQWIISRKKRNPDTAVSDFHQLVLSFDKFGFLPRFPIEYDDYDGLMTGGTHRLACAMFFQIDNIPVIVKARSDERRKKGKPLSIIDGIPFASKENIEVKNKVAAAGMLSRKDTISSINSKVIDLLNEAGAINLGHLNMHEAALGSTNDNPLHGKTFNPHKEGFTPGGSSGGSAAAVACGFSLFSLGTDTLGSIRIPAAYCGVSGIKPSKGLVSLNGIVPLSSSFDALGFGKIMSELYLS